MSALLFLVPPGFAVLLIAAAGLALLFQAKGLAWGFLGAAVAIALLPPLIAPLLDLPPLWLLLLLLVATAFSMIRALLGLGFGRGVADHALGALLADLIRFLLFLPFRLVGGALNALFRRGSR